MSSTGIGEVYNKNRFVTHVKYDLATEPETSTIMGSLRVVGIDANLKSDALLTLHVTNNRKLDFSVSRSDPKGYLIVSNGGFYF